MLIRDPVATGVNERSELTLNGRIGGSGLLQCNCLRPSRLIRSVPSNSTPNIMPTEEDPFDTLLALEDGFYKEGYDLGVSDGDRAGLVEGRVFGFEKGFEKYAAMGRLHGKAAVWSGRVLGPNPTHGICESQIVTGIANGNREGIPPLEKAAGGHAPRLCAGARLEAHVRTLYALTEPESLSTENNEDSVSEFDDRLKRAAGKVRILEKLTGETTNDGTAERSLHHDNQVVPLDFTKSKGDGSIEDVSSLQARH